MPTKKPTIMSTEPNSLPEAAGPALAAMPAPDLVMRELNETKAAYAKLEASFVNLTSERHELAAELDALKENPLILVLSDLDAGSVLKDAGKKLKELTAIVRRRQEKGVISLSLAIKPFKGDALNFIPNVTVKEPKEELAQGIFYASEDGVLSRQDPRQRELPFSRGDRSGEDDGDPYGDEREELRRRR